MSGCGKGRNGESLQLSLDFGPMWPTPEPAPAPDTGPPCEIAPFPGTGDLCPEFRLVSPDDIQADPLQPRRNFSQKGLLELAASIARVGLIEPLVVEENARTGRPYIIIAGERRHRAMLLGRQRWPGNPHFKAARCLVYPPLPGEVRAAFQLEENSRRASLTPYEVAAGLYRARLAMTKNGGAPSWDDVLSVLGISPGKGIRKWLR